MVSETEIKVYPRKDRGGWIIYLPKKIVEDSNFPLDHKKKMKAKIINSKIIIE